MCYLCTACVQVSVSVRETGTDSKSDRALCLRVYMSKLLLCVGFHPGKYEIGLLLCPSGLIMSHFEEYTHEHAYIGDGRQWQYSKIQRHQNLNSSEKQRIAPEYFICRKH